MPIILRHAISLILRVFFRRLEAVGVGHVPPTGPVLFVLNHPNALVDPLLLLALAPRPVVFLGKEPLFRMPVIGQVVRAMGTIPVYRKSDPGADVTRNREMFARVRDVLDAGGAVALFPEGASHSEPRMRPFKTGAARIALAAAAAGSPVRVVPAGLFYTAKATFRSAALLCLGTPLTVSAADADANRDGEPDADAVRDLTARLHDAIAALTIQADQHDAVAIATRAELILTSGDDDDGTPLPLAEQLELRQRLLAGYRTLRESHPERLAHLEHRIARLEARLAKAGLDSETLNYGPLDRRRAATYALRMLAYTFVVFPVVAIGLVLHFPAYRVIGPLATTISRTSSDLVATVKIIFAALLYPLTWAAAGFLVGRWLGFGAGVGAMLIAPATGFLALLFLERMDQFIGESRGVLLLLLRPAAYRNLVHERAQLRADILTLGREVSPG